MRDGEKPIVRKYELTDAGGAQRFIDQQGEHVRWVDARRCWLLWDGARWSRATEAVLYGLVKRMIASIDAEASRSLDDDRLRQDLRRHAQRLEPKAGMDRVLFQARIDGSVQAQPEDLDRDPWLLNVPNGTVDLETGELRDHDPSDLITKMAPVDYDPEARSELWDRFLKRALPDAEVRSFVQRLAGYSLTGHMGEQVLPIVHGPTASSKSKFMEAIVGVMGDYATTASFKTFQRRHDEAGDRARPDLVRLAGARLVACSEVSRNAKIDEAVLKAATGGDSFPIRDLYGSPFTFRPQFKLWTFTNERLGVRGDDDAMWRRVVEVPFDSQVPEGERDPLLSEKLAVPGVRTAILAWSMHGCLSWQEGRLTPPKAVRLATRDARESVDPAREFVRTQVHAAPGERTTTKLIHAELKLWAGERDLRVPGTKALGLALKDDGHVASRTREGLAGSAGATQAGGGTPAGAGGGRARRRPTSRRTRASPR